MSYRIIPDIPLNNGEGKCNNSNCPKPTIYWNDAVRNKETGKKMPLSEPFIGEKPPVPHRCMRQYKPIKYINNTNADFMNNINYNKELFDFLKKIHFSQITLTKSTLKG